MRSGCGLWGSAGRIWKSNSRRKLFPRLARRTQGRRSKREGLRACQRFRHVDVDIDKLDAGLRLAVPGATTPGAFAHLNVRDAIEIEAAPVASGRRGCELSPPEHEYCFFS